MTSRSSVLPRLTAFGTRAAHAAAILVVAVATATLFTASAALAQTERKIVSGPFIAVFDIVGRVRVEPGTGSDVIVEITRGGRDARKLSVEVGEIRGKHTLRVIFPDDEIVYPALGRWSNSNFSVNSDGTWGGERGWGRGHRVRVKGSGSGLEAWADLRLLVPAGKHVEVHLGVGELDANRVDADLTLDAASARVTATGTKGNLTIDTGSGGIEVRGAAGDEISLDTGSGGVSATDVSGKRCKIDTGSGGVSGDRLSCDDLTIDVGSGSIRVDDAKGSRIRLDSGSGGIRFGMTSAPRSLEVESGSGGVTISLPSNVNAEVEIETGSGGIDSDFPVQVTRMERRHLRGTIGDGSGRIRIETGSGSVRLRKN
ncbi:MAG TPA: DUF4097 family beta strand repeat-containing protein [Gemmatimonadaceae bacterium]|nr:DUF4097 family beta strand repeat-containing protein [Gemmatimonadaceae bacterium]